MKLAEIGEAIGLAPSSVSDIERGRIKAPGGDAAMKLDELFKRRASIQVPPSSLSTAHEAG